MPKAIIDFDKTITSGGWDEIGPPKDGVVEALTKLKEMGYDIYIWSCRTSEEVFSSSFKRKEQVDKMKNYMDKNNIPYTDVINRDKVVADIYIGDEAFRCYKDDDGGWDRTIREITTFKM